MHNFICDKQRKFILKIQIQQKVLETIRPYNIDLFVFFIGKRCPFKEEIWKLIITYLIMMKIDYCMYFLQEQMIC